MKINHILKFKKIDKFLIDSLVLNQLYFARPEELNDPFDCQVDIEKSLRNAISQSSGSARETLENIINHSELRKEFNKAQQDLKYWGVFSSSCKSALESSLMWSHYADRHRGVCLVYAMPMKFIDSNEYQIHSIANVKYDSNYLTEWFKKLPANEEIHEEAFSEMIKTVLTIKDICWSYEKEMRIIRKISGIVSIDQSYLQHVCLGLDSSKDERRLIRKIMEKLNYDVGYSEIQRTENDFGIKAVDIS